MTKTLSIKANKKANLIDRLSNTKNLPKHVAIIMDGNGRWAKKRVMPRVQGHKNATKAVRKAVKCARELGLETLTLFAFSTENWKRPKDEVSTLMELFGTYLKSELDGMVKNDICLSVIGSKEGLPKFLHNPLQKAMEATKDNTGLNLILAVNYGSRSEIVGAVQKIICQVQAGSLNADDLTEEILADYLDTKHIKDPDLIIRTSGELRLSNFLLYQAAYSEFVFLDVLWPDFREKHFLNAVEQFQNRKRRLGDV